MNNLFQQEDAVSPRTQGGLERGYKTPIDLQEGIMQTENRMDAVKQDKKDEAYPTGWMRFTKLEYYEQYFRVSESEVIQRVTYSITFPFKPEFIDIAKANPDFYGPFWISTTLIFLLGSIGNFSNYLLSKISSEQVWNNYFFKLQYVREAIILVYTFALGVPVTIYFVLKFTSQKSNVEIPELICLYGYSFFCFLPAIVVCILPVSFIQWLCLLYGLINSSMFIITNLQKHIQGLKQVILYSVVGGIQLVLFLCFKLIFLKLLD